MEKIPPVKINEYVNRPPINTADNLSNLNKQELLKNDKPVPHIGNKHEYINQFDIPEHDEFELVVSTEKPKKA